MAYDSSKRYSWSPEETFTISGRELGLILNTTRAILSTPEANAIILAYETGQIIETIMERSEGEGKLIEMDKPKTE